MSRSWSIDTTKISKLAAEIAKAEGLSRFCFVPYDLTHILIRATEEHDLLRRMYGTREGAADAFDELERVTSQVNRAADSWQAVPAHARELVLGFSSPDFTGDEIAERLHYVRDLLVEFKEHYARAVGNPGRSRSESGADLRPLEGFVHELMDFWIANADMPIGHKVESADDLGEGVREGKSPFMLLIEEAAGGALDVPYTASNFETVVRRLKQERGGT